MDGHIPNRCVRPRVSAAPLASSTTSTMRSSVLSVACGSKSDAATRSACSALAVRRPATTPETRASHTEGMSFLFVLVLSVVAPGQVRDAVQHLAHVERDRHRIEAQIVLDRSFRGIW
jgi:hypothetical protein